MLWKGANHRNWQLWIELWGVGGQAGIFRLHFCTLQEERVPVIHLYLYQRVGTSQSRLKILHRSKQDTIKKSPNSSQTFGKSSLSGDNCGLFKPAMTSYVLATWRQQQEPEPSLKYLRPVLRHLILWRTQAPALTHVVWGNPGEGNPPRHALLKRREQRRNLAEHLQALHTDADRRSERTGLFEPWQTGNGVSGRLCALSSSSPPSSAAHSQVSRAAARSAVSFASL